MSFVGGGATSSAGFTGRVESKTGFAGRRRPKLTPKQRITDLEKIGDDLKDKKEDIESLIDGLDKRDDDIDPAT